jgi:hypothetical protein
MYRKNSADSMRRAMSGRKAWEGKIKGRGTLARASHGLHMGFGGTRHSNGVPCAAPWVDASLNRGAQTPPQPAAA